MAKPTKSLIISRDKLLLCYTSALIKNGNYRRINPTHPCIFYGNLNQLMLAVTTIKGIFI